MAKTMSLLRSEVLNDIYSASIMNDLVFEKTRKVLLSKQKELTKKGKGNKPNADGEEYLEFNERQTKTRTGSDCRDAHPKHCHDGRD